MFRLRTGYCPKTQRSSPIVSNPGTYIEWRLVAERSGTLKARGGHHDRQPVARPRHLLDLSLFGHL
jgi:hypothetical protein